MSTFYLNTTIFIGKSFVIYQFEAVSLSILDVPQLFYQRFGVAAYFPIAKEKRKIDFF
jgi:hypothetical protein